MSKASKIYLSIIPILLVFLLLTLSNYYLTLVPFEFIYYSSLFVVFSIAIYLIIFDQDYFQPLSLILLVFVMRTFLPGKLLLSGLVPSLGITKKDNWFAPELWQPGFSIFLIGILSFSLGWFLFLTSKRNSSRVINLKIDENMLLFSSLAFFIIGALFWLYFFVINFGSPLKIIWALTSGMLRSGEIQMEGTSRYSYLATNFMFWGGIIHSLLLYKRGKKLLLVFLFPILIFILRIPFGGRVVAATPILLVALGVWYQKRHISVQSIKRINLNTLTKKTGVVFSALILALFFSSLFWRFRSAGGIDALFDAISINAFLQYLDMSLWYEMGFISPFAYAEQFGPGCYDVPTSRLWAGGYTAYFLGIAEVRKPGGFITAEVIGSDWGWGIHTGAIVDLFVSFNMGTMLIGLFLLGFVFNYVYSKFIKGTEANILSLILYVFLFNIMFWWQFETIVGCLSSIYENLAFLVLIIIPSWMVQQSIKMKHT